MTKPTSAEALLEQSERANRQLFVAMTRARDTLWVGRIALPTSTAVPAPARTGKTSTAA